MSQIANKPQILHLVSSIELSEDTLVASTAIAVALDRLVELKRQAKVTDMLIKKEEDIIKSNMGDKTHLVRKDGTLAVTWITGADREKLDLDALKREFNDVYTACTSLVPGNRTFLVK